MSQMLTALRLVWQLYSIGSTDMRRLTTGIRSKKFVRRFRRCANVYLHKHRQYTSVLTQTYIVHYSMLLY